MENTNTAAQPLDLDKLVDAYSEAWGKSWESLNPLDECEPLDSECRLHMRAGIEAVVALIAQARAAQPAGAADTTASASIDTPEFQRLLSDFDTESWHADNLGSYEGTDYYAARSRLIAYIDSHTTLAPVAAEQGAADFDECVASGQSCSYRPHGPSGESQCQYCGKADQRAAKSPAAQAVDAPDAEHVARIVTDEDKAALLKIIAELGWEINGTWVITKSDDKMHTLDALAFARTVRSVLAATPASTPEASQQASTVTAPAQPEPIGWADRRVDTGEYGSWLFKSREAAERHGSGNGPAAPKYEPVPVYAAAPAAQQAAPTVCLACSGDNCPTCKTNRAAPTTAGMVEDAKDAARRWQFFSENAQSQIEGKTLAEWLSFDGAMTHGSREAAIDYVMAAHQAQASVKEEGGAA